MRRAVALALFCLLCASAPAGATSAPTGRLLVSLEPRGDRAQAAAPAVLARASARRAGTPVPQIGLVTVRPAAGASLRETAERLRRDPAVRAVDVERRAVPRFVPDDPALSDPETAQGTPEGTVVQWWVQRTGLFEAWDTARGTNALVAVVDSGTDGRHPELSGKIRDAVDVDQTPGAGGALTDETGHGTHVASLACAQSGDGIGMAGAGLECGLMSVKTDFSDSSVIRALVEATDRGAQVINMSFGTDGGREPPAALVDAIRYAAGRNVVLVAAAADEATEEQGDPANLLQPTGTGPDPDVNVGLSVTAATRNDERASFAGRGSQISLAAYGAFDRGIGPRGVLAAWPGQTTTFDQGTLAPTFTPPCRCRTTYRGDDRYAYLQGTSMATGIVSGVAALVRDLNPDLPAAEVVRLLKQTARRAPGTGWSQEVGWGILDARTAVETAKQIDRRAPVSVLRGPTRSRTKRAFTLRWSGRDDAPAGVQASGVAHYDVYRSVDRRTARRIARTTKTKLKVRAGRRGRYAYYTVAVDRAGNREQPPGRPDATVRVAPSQR